MLDPVPFVTDVDVANNLLIAYSRPELDQFFTHGAVGRIAGIDGARDCSTSPLLGFCC
ncbi:MAG: hypothetical protein VX971_09070 [Actinomycetota bacterium]|nr:hypothetical protein [Actinomycetota bacterium]MEC8828858.1 hypothetical protein [Actinomycetota bacterium]MEC9315879.1 hypothetical protein [Actinomycetota bacterium]MEC9339765.1 hypothetical protein [Actinomycetota bacterium]